MTTMGSINMGPLTTPRGAGMLARSTSPTRPIGRQPPRSPRGPHTKLAPLTQVALEQGAFGHHSPMKFQEGGEARSPLRGVADRSPDRNKFVLNPEAEARYMDRINEHFRSPLRDVVRGSQEFMFDPTMLAGAGAAAPFAAAARIAPRIPALLKYLARLKRLGSLGGLPALGAGFGSYYGEAEAPPYEDMSEER